MITIISGRKDSAKFSICVFITLSISFNARNVNCYILSQIIVLEKYDSVERRKKVKCDFHPSGYLQLI